METCPKKWSQAVTTEAFTEFQEFRVLVLYQLDWEAQEVLDFYRFTVTCRYKDLI